MDQNAHSSIEIIATPAGEAPEWVRQAWVGVVIPLVESKVVTTKGIGVITSAKAGWLSCLWWQLTGRIQSYTGYVVRFDDAISRLSVLSPDAARWWRQNTPHLIGQNLMFKTEECRPC